jgi:hypothetical protein
MTLQASILTKNTVSKNLNEKNTTLTFYKLHIKIYTLCTLRILQLNKKPLPTSKILKQNLNIPISFSDVLHGKNYPENYLELLFLSTSVQHGSKLGAMLISPEHLRGEHIEMS